MHAYMVNKKETNLSVFPCVTQSPLGPQHITAAARSASPRVRAGTHTQMAELVAANAVRVWQIWSAWWSSPLFEAGAKGGGTLAMRAAARAAARKAAGAAAASSASAANLNPPMLVLGTLVGLIFRMAAQSAPAALAPAVAGPAGPPAAMAWRIAWLLLTSMLGFVAPPAMSNAWRGLMGQRGRLASLGNATDAPASDASGAWVCDEFGNCDSVWMNSTVGSGAPLAVHGLIKESELVVAYVPLALILLTAGVWWLRRRHRAAVGELERLDELERQFEQEQRQQRRREAAAAKERERGARQPNTPTTDPISARMRSHPMSPSSPRQLSFDRLAYAEADIRMERAVRRLALNRLTRGWVTWVEAAMERARLRSFLAPMIADKLSAAWNSWRALATEQRMIATFDLGRLTARWDHWVLVVTAIRPMRVAVREWRGARQRAAWRSWVEMAMERRMMANAARAFRFPTQRKGLVTWREYAVQSGQAKAQLRAALLSLHATGLRRAVNTWRAITERLVGLRKPLLSLLDINVRRGFNAWVAASRCTTAAGALLRHALSTLLNQRLRRAINSWHAVQLQMAATRPLLQRAVSRLRNQHLSRCWQSWLERNAARSESLRRLRASVSFLLRRNLALAFASWKYARLHLANANAKQNTMRGVLHVMRNRQLARCWLSWRAMSESGTRNAQRLMAATSEWRGSRRRAAWSTWCDVVRAHQLLAECIAQRIMGRLSRSWSLWISATQLNAELLKEQRRCLRAAAREWRGARIRAAWYTWWESVRHQRMLQRATNYFRFPCQHRALLSWAEYAMQTGQAKTQLRAALMSLRATGFRRAVNTWSGVVERLTGLRKPLLSLFRIRMRQGFNTWNTIARARVTSEELMSRSLRSLHNIPLRFGMNSWSSFAAERSAQLSALQSAASALRSRTVRAALNSWVEHAVASAESERMLRKAASSLSPRVRSMRRAFNSWSAVWIQLRSLRRGAMALTQSGLRAGFSSWFEFALLAEEKRAVMWQCRVALQQRGVRSALNTWSAFARSTRRLGASCSPLHRRSVVMASTRRSTRGTSSAQRLRSCHRR